MSRTSRAKDRHYGKNSPQMGLVERIQALRCNKDFKQLIRYLLQEYPEYIRKREDGYIIDLDRMSNPTVEAVSAYVIGSLEFKGSPQK